MTWHPQPSVSAIVPARNEELNIARSVLSLAAQPEILEIIVVDDQSEDRTGEILEALEKQYPVLRVVLVDDLPAGWVGKPHALAAGARLARGEWLLFTDADAEHRPGSLRALLAKAEDARADLLSVSPGQKLTTWWEKSVIPLVFTQLAELYPFHRVSDPRSPVAAANGQYILVRRATYESVGGHAATPEAVLEDVDLARRVKSSSGRLVFLPGAEWIETRMYHSFSEMRTGWTKNLFLLYRRDVHTVRRAVGKLLGHWAVGFDWLVISAWLLCALWLRLERRHPLGLAGWLPILLGLELLSILLVLQERYRRALRRSGFPTRLAKYFFLGAPLVSLLLLESVWAYRRRGLIHWKGRVYSVGQPR